LIKNNAPAIKSLTVAKTATTVSITTSITDLDNDRCSVSIEFSIDGGKTYKSIATNTGMVSSAVNTTTWNFKADITKNEPSVYIKVTPNDGTVNGTARLIATSLIKNVVPTVKSLTVTKTTTAVSISYAITDTDNDICSAVAEFSVDGGRTYKPTTITGTTAGIVSNAVNTITWDYKTDLTKSEPRVNIRITPNDGTAKGTVRVSNTVSLVK